MTFVRSTDYETEVIQSRIEDAEKFLPAIVAVPAVALQRYEITTIESSASDSGVVVKCATNDDDDNGVPDGAWQYWTEKYGSVEQALKQKGKCRVTEVTNVIVTVTVDGKEVR